MDDIERIARQAGLVDARFGNANVAMAGFIGAGLRDGDLGRAEIDARDHAVRANLLGKPAQCVAGAAAKIGDLRTARDADGRMMRAASGP